MLRIPSNLPGEVPEEHQMREVGLSRGLARPRATPSISTLQRKSADCRARAGAGTGRLASRARAAAAKGPSSRSPAPARCASVQPAPCVDLRSCLESHGISPRPRMSPSQTLKSHPVSIRSEANKKRRQVRPGPAPQLLLACPAGRQARAHRTVHAGGAGAATTGGAGRQ